MPNSDNSACIPCVTGCSVCLAGFEVSGGNCVQCQSGYISALGGSCSKCLYNQITNTAHTSCITCTQVGYVPSADRLTCVPCSTGCSVCPVNFGYSSIDNTCTACNPQSASDGTELCFSCGLGQVPNAAGICLNCQTNCQECPPAYGYNSYERICARCTPGYYSAGGTATCSYCQASPPQVPNADQTACVTCGQGMVVSLDYTTCVPCQVSCSICPPNYGLNNGVCTQCPYGQSSNGTTACGACVPLSCNTCPQNASICVTCLNSLFVSADGFTCSPCSTARTFDQCSQSSCSGYVFYNSACISNCSAVSKSNPSQPTPVNGACSCLIGYVWSSTSGCIPCSSNTITRDQCTSSQCTNYFMSTFGTV